MKRFLSVILFALAVWGLCACSSFSSLTYDGVSDIPDDGIITASRLKSIRDGGSVAVFAGRSGDYRYEWTLFSSDIKEEIHDICLLAELNDGNGDMTLEAELGSHEAFGFPAVLSVYLDTKWNTSEAVVYRIEADGSKTAVSTASVTGSDSSILNFSLTEQYGRFVIVGDSAPSSDLPGGAGDSSGDFSSDTSGNAVTDPYLSRPGASDNDMPAGNGTAVDEFKTEPAPDEKPAPSKPQNQETDRSKSFYCTFSVECSSVFNNLSQLDKSKLEILPTDGVMLKKQSVTVYDGESVYDVLKRVCRENGIHLEASFTPVYNTAYVEGIGNLYEFDCGPLSGWTYLVNGQSPNCGCSQITLSEGDKVEWRYSCELGRDVGANGRGDAK